MKKLLALLAVLLLVSSGVQAGLKAVVTSSGGGGGGNPGGTNGQIQYNNSGAFGGVTAVPIANGGTNLTALGSANQCLQVNGAGTALVYGSCSAGGSVTTTGSPATGNLTKFSGATSITNGDLSGDVTTSGTLATTVLSVGHVTTGTLSVANGGTNATTANVATYNLSQQVLLPHWRVALGKVASNQGNAKILFIGDSTTIGACSLSTSGSCSGSSGNTVSNSFPTQLSKMFNSVGINANWNAWLGDQGTTGGGQDLSNDSRVTLGSGWAQNTFANSVGGGSVGQTSGSAALTFTPTQSVDTFKVYCLQNTTEGTIALSMTGGSGSLNCNSGSTGIITTTVTGTLGTNTLSITRSAGSSNNIAFEEAWDSTKSQVIMDNAGWSGSQTSHWDDTSVPAWSPGSSNVYSKLLPDLVIIDLGINDWDAGVTGATFKTNLQVVISAIQTGAPNADILLVAPNPTNPSGHASLGQQAAIVTALYQLAASDNLPIIDLTNRWVSYAVAQPQGFYGDTFTHPDGAGYTDIATAIFDAIANPGTSAQTSGSGTVTSFSCVTANGVSCSVANATTTPAATFTLGAITPTTVNKVTLTTPATGSTLTIANGKTLTDNNSITFAGTDSTTMTFPAASDTVAGLGTTQTYTKSQRVSPVTDSISTATFTPDFSASNNHNITLVHASCPCTLANPTNIVAGQSGQIVINQSSTGGDLINTYGNDYIFTNLTAPILSTGANASDVFSYYVIDSTHIRISPLISTPLTALSGSTGTPTCGTGCSSITAGSTNSRGSMVSGSSVSAVTVNWSGTLSSAPFCTISDSNTSAVSDISALSTSAMTVSLASALSSVTIYWVCPQ